MSHNLWQDKGLMDYLSCMIISIEDKVVIKQSDRVVVEAIQYLFGQLNSN